VIDPYPIHLREKIDAVTPWMQSDFNTGVYKAGFASSQEEYNKNIIPVFGALNKLEKIIANNGGPFVLGRDLTELDIRLYATIIRFDTVYVQHFKCNLGTIRHGYPVLNNWLKGMYWNNEAARDSTNFLHIKENVCRHAFFGNFRYQLTLYSIQRVMRISIQRQSPLWARFLTLRQGLNWIGTS
jgi:putative glutathione S-transferase